MTGPALPAVVVRTVRVERGEDAAHAIDREVLTLTPRYRIVAIAPALMILIGAGFYDVRKYVIVAELAPPPAPPARPDPWPTCPYCGQRHVKAGLSNLYGHCTLPVCEWCGTRHATTLRCDAAARAMLDQEPRP